MSPEQSQTEKLLLDHYLEFQREKGQRKNLVDFAEYLQVHKSTLSLVMNGSRNLSKNLAAQFASITGDYRFYDIVGIPRPELPKQIISLQGLTPDQIEAIHQMVEKYQIKNERKNQPTTTPADQLT